MRGFTIVVSPNLSFTSTTSMRVRQMMPESQKKETLLQPSATHLHWPACQRSRFLFQFEGQRRSVISMPRFSTLTGMCFRTLLPRPTNRTVLRDPIARWNLRPVPTETDLEDWKTSDGLTLPICARPKERRALEHDAVHRNPDQPIR